MLCRHCSWRRRQVGHKALKPVNETDTSFTAKRLQVPLQKLGEGGSGDSDDDDRSDRTHKFPPIGDLIAHSRHHNPSVRKDALLTLKSLWLAAPGTVHGSLAKVIDAVGQRMTDDAGSVRAALLTLLEHVVGVTHTVNDAGSALPQAVLQPFFRLAVVYLTAALTSITPGIRLDAVAYVALLCRRYPALFRNDAPELVRCLAVLVSPSQHEITVTSLVHAGAEGCRRGW